MPRHLERSIKISAYVLLSALTVVQASAEEPSGTSGTTYTLPHLWRCRLARGEFVFADAQEAVEFVEIVRRVRDLDDWKVLAWCLMGVR
jgi:hypothetical protein